MRSKSFLVPIVLSMAVLFGVTALPFGFFMEKQLQQALYYTTQAGVTQNVQRLGAVLEPSLCREDLSQVKKILSTYMNDPSILGIILYDPRGTILTSVQRSETGNLIPLHDLLLFRSALPRESYSINHSLFYEGDFKGKVETYISITPARQGTLALRSSLFYTLSLFALLFTCFLIFLLHRFLRGPLLEIQSFLEIFTEKNLLSAWKSHARQKENPQEPQKDLLRDLFPHHERILRREDEVGALGKSLLEVLKNTRREILRQEKNMETLEENNTRLIEDLSILRQQKIEMEQYLREMEKNMRFLESRNALQSSQEEEA
jgi:hypothetical protein